MSAQGSAITCKSCGTQYRFKPQLAGKTVQCKCGTMIAVPAMVSGAAAMYADRIPRQYSPPEETGPSKLRIGAGVLAVLAVAAGAMWFLRGSADDMPGALAGDDTKIIDTLHEYGAIEARQWMKAYGGRMLMGMTNEQAARFVDKIYDMGAVRVLAWGGHMATLLALELPADQQKRKAIFDWHRQWQRGTMVPSPADVGQRYLVVNLKL